MGRHAFRVPALFLGMVALVVALRRLFIWQPLTWLTWPVYLSLAVIFAIVSILIVMRRLPERDWEATKKEDEEKIARLATLLEMHPSPVIETHTGGAVIYMNSAAQRVFPEVWESGTNHPVLQGFSEIIHYFQKGADKSFVRALHIGEVWYEQIFCFLPEGEVIRVYLNDITERKKTENKVVKQNHYLNVLYNMSLEIVKRLDLQELLQAIVEKAITLSEAVHGYIFLVDEKRQLAELKAASGFYEQFIGMKVKKGQGFDGRIWESGEPMAVNDYNTWDKKLEGYFKTGVWDITGVPLIVDQRVVGMLGLSHLDGRKSLPQDVIQILSKFAALVSIALDNAMLYEQAQREIYNRKKMQQALVESEKKYRMLFENGNDPILVYEVHKEVPGRGKIIAANENACRFLGYSKQELLSLLPEDLTDTDDLTKMQVRRKLLAEGNVIFEARAVKQNGARVPIEVSLQLFEPNGVPMVLSSSRDITERRRAEEQKLALQRKEAMLERLASLGTMVAGVAHEINQPLQALSVTVQGLQYWYKRGVNPSVGKMMESCERIAGQAVRIDKIVKQLRFFVQRSQGEKTVAVCWNEVVLNALEMVGAQLMARGIEVHKEFESPLPAVLGDAGRLEEVVINILVNAMQAMDKAENGEKRVMIATRADDKNVFLEIADTGPGIDQPVLEKMFEPFFTTKESSEGMGLGLALVQSIVVACGGQVKARNIAGGGASFVIEFPIYRPDMDKTKHIILS
jgi:PAS domain S-box-containing protein